MFVSGALIMQASKGLGVHVFENLHRDQLSFVVCAPQISLKGPQFLWTQPEFLDCPRFDRYGFQEKQIYRTPEANEKKSAALQVGSKGIERVMYRRLHGSFELSL